MFVANEPTQGDWRPTGERRWLRLEGPVFGRYKELNRPGLTLTLAELTECRLLGNWLCGANREKKTFTDRAVVQAVRAELGASPERVVDADAPRVYQAASIVWSNLSQLAAQQSPTAPLTGTARERRNSVQDWLDAQMCLLARAMRTDGLGLYASDVVRQMPEEVRHELVRALAGEYLDGPAATAAASFSMTQTSVTPEEANATMWAQSIAVLHLATRLRALDRTDAAYRLTLAGLTHFHQWLRGYVFARLEGTAFMTLSREPARVSMWQDVIKALLIGDATLELLGETAECQFRLGCRDGEFARPIMEQSSVDLVRRLRAALNMDAISSWLDTAMREYFRR